MSLLWITAGRDDDPLAAPTRLSGGDTAKSRCNCEHAVHWPDGNGHPEYGNSEWHPYGTDQEGSHEARYIGEVCSDCARTHMKDYIL